MSITIIFDRGLGITNNFQGGLVVAEYTRVLDLPNLGNNLKINDFEMFVYARCLNLHQNKQKGGLRGGIQKVNSEEFFQWEFNEEYRDFRGGSQTKVCRIE